MHKYLMFAHKYQMFNKTEHLTHNISEGASYQISHMRPTPEQEK